MNPLLQQVKELLESADPQIRVVDCQTLCGFPTGLAVKPVHPDHPGDVSTTDRQ